MYSERYSTSTEFQIINITIVESRSVFILSNTPIITTDSRCDGYEDCFDQSDEVGCEEIEIGASNNTVEDDYDTNDLYENEYPT